MNRSEFVQAVTLWFVVVIFLQIEPGTADNVAGTVAAIAAIGLLYLVPAYLLVGIVREFLPERGTAETNP